MLLKQYKVTILNADIAAQAGKEVFVITASGIESAWRKFKRQHFGTLQPNPSDYDVSFYRTLSI